MADNGDVDQKDSDNDDILSSSDDEDVDDRVTIH